MEREEPTEENEYRCKSIVKPEEVLLKAQRITAVEIYKIKENIRHKKGDDTDDYTNVVNGDKIDANVIEHQKRDQQNNITGFGKVENYKHPSAEGEQHTVKTNETPT